MKFATLKAAATKGILAALAAGTLMVAGATQANAQEVVVRAGFGRPAYVAPYNRFEFQRRQEFLRREAFLRHEQWVRYHRGYGYR